MEVIDELKDYSYKKICHDCFKEKKVYCKIYIKDSSFTAQFV